ncbi:MAG: flagellar hook-length control protein FliK [Oscillospiraceae bacterium]
MDMQIIANMQANVQTQAMAQALSGEVRIAQQSGADTDNNAFMQMLQQMLNGNVSEGTDTILQAQLQGELMDSNDKKSAENGALLIAELLAKNPELSGIIPQLMAMTSGAEGNGSAIQNNIADVLGSVNSNQGAGEVLEQLLQNAKNNAEQNVSATMHAQDKPISPQQAVDYDKLIAQLKGNAEAQPQTEQASVQDEGLALTAAIPKESTIKAEIVQTTDTIAQKEAIATGEADFAKAVAQAKAQGQSTSEQQENTDGNKQSKADTQNTEIKATAQNEAQKSEKPDKEKDDGSTQTRLAQSTFAERLAQPNVREAQNTAPVIDKKAVLEQISNGAMENAAKGKQDFVMKLTPDGMGEITVKLAEANGHITMQLTASNANVQKMLTSELENLREVMRPYKVEVREVQAQTQQHFDMSGNQQDAQQQHRELAQQFAFAREQQQNARPYYGSYISKTSKIAEQTVMPQQSILQQRAIDRYI